MGCKRIKTGIYSGSFNPIHIGHLALANWLCEYTDLEEVWFMVTPHNPLKDKRNLLDDSIRLELVRIATSDYPHFQVSDLEFTMPQPSYTYATLSTLRNKFEDREFCLIMGADNWQIFGQWKNHDNIMNEFPIYIYPRNGYKIVIPENCKNANAVPAPIIEISSTFIRNSIKAGKDIRFFLPEKVGEYISNNKLYIE